MTRKPTPFKRRDKRYEVGIVWIACYDESAERDHETVSMLPSVILMSNMYNLTSEDVASDVLKVRHHLFKKTAEQVRHSMYCELGVNWKECPACAKHANES